MDPRANPLRVPSSFLPQLKCMYMLTIPQQEKEFSIQPIKDKFDSKFAAHKATPGPAISKDLGGVKEEGTKEERKAKAQALNN